MGIEVDAPVVMDTAESTEEEWLKERRNGIGGSDVSKIMGVNPWSGPHEIYLKKRGEVPISTEKNNAMEWGHRLEDVVGKAFFEKNDDITEVSDPHKMFRHHDEQLEFMFADPDFLIDSEEHDGTGVLEIKTTGKHNAHLWDDEIPVWVLPQVQHYLDVLDLEWGYVGVLIGKDDYRQYPIKRSPEMVELIREECQRFWWNHVLEGNEPEIDGSESAKKFLEQKYDDRTEAEPVILDSEEARQLMNRHDEIKQSMDELEDSMDEVKNRFRDMVGNNTKAKVQMEDGERTITWNERENFSWDADQLEELLDNGDIQEAKNEYSYDVFRIH